MKLPSTFDPLATKLEHQFDEMATLFSKSFGPFSFANIVKGKVVLLKDDALFIPPDVKKLRQLIQAQMPPTRIEKMFAEADQLSGFSKAFVPFHDEYRDTELPKKSIYAAVIAHATNMGLYGMGHCATGVSTEMIKTASQEYLRAETVTNASSAIIKRHLQYPISKAFGDKSWSGSDAERFGIQASSLLGSCYPRFFGYYDQAISIYTHIADTFDVFSTQVISCAEREATYVLTGLLAAYKSDIHPQFHCTDTHGFTEHVFALSYLLGFSFCPRLKDLKEQRLYKISKDKNYGALEPLFSGVINMQLIHDNWDQIVRIIAALKNGHIPAHVIIQKLANRTDHVAKAIQELGRLVKTIYLLRYLSDDELRYKVHLQLNRGESRHGLARAVFFVNQGIFKTNDYEEIMNKASCLSLISNAILLWNTHHIQNIVDKLRKEGHGLLVDEYLNKISPLIFKHIQIHGTYDFEHLLEQLSQGVIMRTIC